MNFYLLVDFLEGVAKETTHEFVHLVVVAADYAVLLELASGGEGFGPLGGEVVVDADGGFDRG